jgi:hypothetical protein
MPRFVRFLASHRAVHCYAVHLQIVQIGNIQPPRSALCYTRYTCKDLAWINMHRLLASIAEAQVLHRLGLQRFIAILAATYLCFSLNLSSGLHLNS